MFELIHAALTLVLTGDFQGWMVPLLGEEDSYLVDLLLRVSGR